MRMVTVMRWSRMQMMRQMRAANKPRHQSEKGKAPLVAAKRVTFCEEQDFLEEVLEPSTGGNNGTRFSEEDDHIIRNIATEVFEEAGILEDGFEGLLEGPRKLKTKYYDKLVEVFPNRTRAQLSRRARSILEVHNRVGWTAQDFTTLTNLIAEHGENWKKIASIMGRRKENVRNKFRYMQTYKNGGRWQPEEIEKLCSLVHKDLALQTLHGQSTAKKICGISWQPIASVLGRPSTTCMRHWYNVLGSRLMKINEWTVQNDTQLVTSILESGAVDEDCIDWGSLVENRSATLCEERWKQMCSKLGKNKKSDFSIKLELLMKRFAPAFLDLSFRVE